MLLCNPIGTRELRRYCNASNKNSSCMITSPFNSFKRNRSYLLTLGKFQFSGPTIPELRPLQKMKHCVQGRHGRMLQTKWNERNTAQFIIYRNLYCKWTVIVARSLCMKVKEYSTVNKRCSERDIIMSCQFSIQIEQANCVTLIYQQLLSFVKFVNCLESYVMKEI